ncbi:unnamed protein product [Schistosoma turkestanicum]|nr:unnamed protein product [Schistosoma turkestanicum]
MLIIKAIKNNKYISLDAIIKQRCPSASVNIHAGRSRSFEITVNGKLIFSKLKCDHFPLTEAIISELIEIENSATPKEVIEYETSNCNLL